MESAGVSSLVCGVISSPRADRLSGKPQNPNTGEFLTRWWTIAGPCYIDHKLVPVSPRLLALTDLFEAEYSGNFKRQGQSCLQRTGHQFTFRILQERRQKWGFSRQNVAEILGCYHLKQTVGSAEITPEDHWVIILFGRTPTTYATISTRCKTNAQVLPVSDTLKENPRNTDKTKKKPP